MATENVQFSFNNLFFRQTDAVAIGSSLGLILANIFIRYYENFFPAMKFAIYILHVF